MSLQVLVQMPLLVLVGGGLATAFPARARQTMAAWNWQGVTGLLLASGAMACWMLPRVMDAAATQARSEEHTSELQSLMRISYAVFCLKKNITSLLLYH